MNLLRHMVAGIAVFAIFIGMITAIYMNLEETYSFTRQVTALDASNDDSIGERLDNLLILKGFDDVTSIFKLKKFDVTDIIGGLAKSGLGVIESLLGTLAFPFQMGSIILDFYEVPPILINGLLIVMCIYAGFILISVMVGRDV